MLPIGTNTSAYILQPPLVNTATPGTAVVHVPPDNVAPSVSGSQVDNNTKGNSAPPSSSDEQVAAATSANTTDSGTSSGTLSSSSATLSANAQATFIAQLASQDDTQETHIVLSQYEKLVEFSQVKYKPSNAFKPPSAPSGLFGRILQSEKTAANVAPVTAPPPTPISPSTSAGTLTVNDTGSASEVIAVPTADTSPVDLGAPLQTSTADTTAPLVSNSQISAIPPAAEPLQIALPAVTVPTPDPQAINAYIASTARVAIQSTASTQQLA